MSLRPALRPALAAAKERSHCRSSERRFWAYAGGLAASFSVVIDIVVVVV